MSRIEPIIAFVEDGREPSENFPKSNPIDMEDQPPRTNSNPCCINFEMKNHFGSLVDADTKAKIRSDNITEKLRKIVMNEADAEQIPFYYMFLGLSGPIFGAMQIFLGLILVPMKDPIVDQSAWYQCFLLCGFLCSASAVGFFVTSSTHWLNITGLMNLGVCLRIYASAFFFNITSWTLLWALWTQALNLNYPIPFIGKLSFSICFAAMCFMTWFIFPSDWRSNPQFRTKLKLILFAQLFVIIHYFIYIGLIGVPFSLVPTNYQLFLAFVLPLTREILTYMLSKLCFKAAG